MKKDVEKKKNKKGKKAGLKTFSSFNGEKNVQKSKFETLEMHR